MAQIREDAKEIADNNEALIKQLKMEVSALRHVVDNCNSRVANSQFSENELKKKMAKMVVAIRDKSDSDSIFSSIVHQFPNTRTEISVILYNDMIEKGAASPNQPVRNIQASSKAASSPPAPATSTSATTPNKKKPSKVDRKSVSVSDIPGTQFSTGFSEEEMLKLSTALSLASKQRDEMKDNLDITKEKLRKANEEVEDLKNQLTYLNREFEVLRGRKESVQEEPSIFQKFVNFFFPSARPTIQQQASVSSMTGVSFQTSGTAGSGGLSGGGLPSQGTNGSTAMNSGANNTWSCMLLMALWSVVAALDESETNRRIEQERRIIEDEATTGRGIRRQLQNFTTTVRGKFHSIHTAKESSKIPTQMFSNHTSASFKLKQKQKKGYDDVGSESQDGACDLDELDQGINDDENEENQENVSREDDDETRRASMAPLMRRASTNDVQLISLRGKGNSNQKFNVLPSSAHQSKWGGVTIDNSIDSASGGGGGGGGLIDSVKANGPPPARSKGRNVKTEPIKFES